MERVNIIHTDSTADEALVANPASIPGTARNNSRVIPGVTPPPQIGVDLS